jgi:YHS domain-containing protein
MKRPLLCVVIALTLGVVAALAAKSKVYKPEYFCMMQDMVLNKPGIALQHEGKTYYGCCAMCKEKIKSEPHRYTLATDPVSGKQVDKAVAFIYGLNGDAYYFASDANRKAFAANPQKYLNK